MITRFRAACLFLMSAAVLSACGSASSSGGEDTLSADTPTPAGPTATITATEIVRPSATPTPARTDPLPGMVYVAPDPEKGLVGPFLVEADGESTQLSDKTDPVLSPDRTQMLYSDNEDIWILDFTTEKTRNLTKTKDRIECCYQWWPAQPDLIVFHYQPTDDLGPGAGYLTSMKPDGSNVLLLDEETGSISPAALSPDGQSIAYDRAGQPWVYNFLAGKMPIFPKTFTGFRLAVNPAWSPDSRRIAWQLFGIPTEQEDTSAVAILDLDILDVNLLHSYTVVGGSDIGPNHLSWSPDGEWLAVANQSELVEEGKISLWVMRPDGSEEIHIGSGDLPIWSPDGSMLLYTASDGAYVVKTGEWAPVRVTLPKDARVIDWVELD